MNPKFRQYIIKPLEEISEEFAAYLLALLLLIPAFYVSRWSDTHSTILYYFSLTILIYGFYVYISESFNFFWKSILGKVTLSTAILLGSTFSLSLSNILINTSLQVPSSPFIYTQTLIAVLIAPLITSIIFGVFLFIPLMFLVFISSQNLSAKNILAFWKNKKNSEIGLGKAFIRFFILMILISICWSFNSKSEWYLGEIEKFTRWYIFNFETEVYSHCLLQDGQRIAYINGTNIILATKTDDNYTFATSNCEKPNEPTTLK